MKNHSIARNRQRSLLAVTALGGVLALNLSACDRRPDGQMSDRAAAQAPKQSENLSAAIGDTGITAQVKGRLASDQRTKSADISVQTNNGVVTLSGTAPDASARQAAEELARTVPEVQGIDNRIEAPGTIESLAADAKEATKKAGEAVDDTWITTKIKTALLADSGTKGSDISVSTSKGVVTLSGKVRSNDEHARAVDIARSTEGVGKVESTQLTVSR